MHDAEYHYFKNFAIKEKKPGFINRMFDKFENFMMDFSMRDVNEYLSQSQNRYDLEQREKRVMRGDFKLVYLFLAGVEGIRLHPIRRLFGSRFQYIREIN